MYFDSHCHLDRIDLQGFDNNFDNLLQAIADGDVTRLVCIGVDLDSFDAMQQLIQPYDQVFCSAGVHPDYADASEPSVEILCELAVRDKVVAIGETGLDYFHQSGELDWQRARFVTHIEAARSCGLPLIVHTRDARKDTLDLLRRHKADEVGGVLHCFTEDWEMASAAQNVRDMAKQIPLERLLIETDSPWLSPAPFRGKTNHPGRVGLVAEKLAEIRGESLQDLATATYRNANRLFGLS